MIPNIPDKEDPEEYQRYLLTLDPNKHWTGKDLDDPKVAAMSLFIIKRAAKDGAPPGTDPFKRDFDEVKANFQKGLGFTAAFEQASMTAAKQAVGHATSKIAKDAREKG